jgi:predicted ester cyclase
MAAEPHPTESDGARTVRRYVAEFLSGGDVATATALAHEELRVHQLGDDVERSGRTLTVKQVQGLRESVPDYRLTVDELFDGGDTVTVRATASGTPTRTWNGLVPTGRSFAVPTVHVFRLEDGRIVEHWELADRLGVCQQLGLIPPTPRALLALGRSRLWRWLSGRLGRS